jgi:hypothetical protein
VALRHRAPPHPAPAPTLRLTPAAPATAGGGGVENPADQATEASEPDAGRRLARREVSAGRRYRAACSFRCLRPRGVHGLPSGTFWVGCGGGPRGPPQTQDRTPRGPLADLRCYNPTATFRPGRVPGCNRLTSSFGRRRAERCPRGRRGGGRPARQLRLAPRGGGARRAGGAAREGQGERRPEESRRGGADSRGTTLFRVVMCDVMMYLMYTFGSKSLLYVISGEPMFTSKSNTFGNLIHNSLIRQIICTSSPSQYSLPD